MSLHSLSSVHLETRTVQCTASLGVASAWLAVTTTWAARKQLDWPENVPSSHVPKRGQEMLLDAVANPRFPFPRQQWRRRRTSILGKMCPARTCPVLPLPVDVVDWLSRRQVLAPLATEQIFVTWLMRQPLEDPTPTRLQCTCDSPLSPTARPGLTVLALEVLWAAYSGSTGKETWSGVAQQVGMRRSLPFAETKSQVLQAPRSCRWQTRTRRSRKQEQRVGAWAIDNPSSPSEQTWFRGATLGTLPDAPDIQTKEVTQPSRALRRCPVLLGQPCPGIHHAWLHSFC